MLQQESSGFHGAVLTKALISINRAALCCSNTGTTSKAKCQRLYYTETLSALLKTCSMTSTLGNTTGETSNPANIFSTDTADLRQGTAKLVAGRASPLCLDVTAVVQRRLLVASCY